MERSTEGRLFGHKSERPALAVLGNLAPEDRQKLDVLVVALKNRFGTTHQTKLSRMKFKNWMGLDLRTGSEKKQCKIWINGAEVTIEPDTGADANVMDEYQFSKLKKETTETSLKRTKISLKTVTDGLRVIGECQVLMENETRKTQATIAIV